MTNSASFSHGLRSIHAVESEGDRDSDSNVVDDGYSGIFPRTRIMLGSDVASVAWSVAGDIENGGIIEGKATDMGPTFTPSSSVVDPDLSDGDDMTDLT